MYVFLFSPPTPIQSNFPKYLNSPIVNLFNTFMDDNEAIDDRDIWNTDIRIPDIRVTNIRDDNKAMDVEVDDVCMYVYIYIYIYI
jgi:hypothetical protein